MAHLILSDAQIAELLAEPKQTPDGVCLLKSMPERNRHKHKEFDIECGSENKYRIMVRQLCANPLDFSVILAYQLPGLFAYLRLRRYNGLHAGVHTNVLERTKVTGFHIHTATERYETAGLKPDAFAEPTNRYWDLESAVLCMLNDCGFPSSAEEGPLFRPRPSN
jgi:hypothetical protein